jgi:hypothetical protein
MFLNIPFVCLNSSDSFGISGSWERYSIGVSLELGKLSSSFIEEDDEEVGGCGRFPWAL